MRPYGIGRETTHFREARMKVTVSANQKWDALTSQKGDHKKRLERIFDADIYIHGRKGQTGGRLRQRENLNV